MAPLYVRKAIVMKHSEILNGAADYLQTYGTVAGTFGNKGQGFCALGALHAYCMDQVESLSATERLDGYQETAAVLAQLLSLPVATDRYNQPGLDWIETATGKVVQ